MPFRMNDRNSSDTLPDATYLLLSTSAAASLNSRPCGQVKDANSISFTGASGLPMRTPPSVVATTNLVQSFPRAGASLLAAARSAEQQSELQSLMRISYAVFCLQPNNIM